MIRKLLLTDLVVIATTFIITGLLSTKGKAPADEPRFVKWVANVWFVALFIAFPALMVAWIWSNA